MQKITTFLAFQDRAEEAADFYVSIFKRSKIVKTLRNGEGWPGPEGSVLTVAFQLEGQDFVAMNGGPHFKFTQAISLSVNADTQKEIDELSAKLTSGGGEQLPCGWVTDKFGLSWQVNPSILIEGIGDPDPVKAKRVLDAMLRMTKIDVEAVKKAYAGR